MFRLFLRSKVLSADKNTATNAASETRVAVADSVRNRRVFQRFPMDHKHLTLMNEQDILLVREVSAKGFSTEVAPRTIDRLTQGDVYEGRVRYLKEMYDLKARVAWKSAPYIGFEIVDCPAETLVFIKRLIRPMEIAFSLKEVDAAFLTTSEENKRWFHGDHNSDLYVWRDPVSNAIAAWQLTFENFYVEWRMSSGVVTGATRRQDGKGSGVTVGTGANVSFGMPAAELDRSPDPEKRRFAVDVLVALPDAELSTDILRTLDIQP